MGEEGPAPLPSQGTEPGSAPGTEPRRLPWRILAIFFVPFAALAAATGLQRWFEGPAPSGDTLLRWLLFASVAGLVVGGITGLVLGRSRLERYGFAALGVVGPWLATVVITGVLLGVRKGQERWALHQLRECRASGRALCRQAEFQGACAAAASRDPALRDAARRSLGVPTTKNCDRGWCESRWSYEGPWGAEDATAKQVCSVVTDTAGHFGRWMMLGGDEQ